MLGKVVAARIALKELEAQCRLECRYPTTDGCMVGPSAASGQRDGTRPGNGEEEAEVVPVEGRRGHMCNSTQNWREIPDFCEDSLMLRSFLKPKNQQDDEGWFSCRRSSYRARCASAPARWMSCLPRFRSPACARRRSSRTPFLPAAGRLIDWFRSLPPPGSRPERIAR